MIFLVILNIITLTAILAAYVAVGATERKVKADMQRQYPGREFSPTYTGIDGNRWKYELRTGRIIPA